MIRNRAQDVMSKKGFSPVVTPEVIIRVGIFDSRTRVQSQEFLVLGSQTLAEFKDSISCLTDKVYGCRYSRSAYFFIEDVFYDDMRPAPVPNPVAPAPPVNDTSNSVDLKEGDSIQTELPDPAEEGKMDVDPEPSQNSSTVQSDEQMDVVQPIRYSDIICDWVKQNRRYTQPGLTRFSQGLMENTRIGDLRIRLNSFYYFVHHGECTHVVVFKEIRMFDRFSDYANRHVYPLLVYQPRQKVKKCGVCDIYAAKKVAYGDPLAPESPWFYCDTCYHQYHYDADGNLLHPDFQVFPYFHD
jgi:snRNA-activating protein complex subunit 3